MKIGDCLGDMHGSSFHSLSCLIHNMKQDGYVPSFSESSRLARTIKEIVRYCEVSVEDGHEIIEQMIRKNAPRDVDKQFPNFRFYTNKMLHIVGHSPSTGDYVVAYAYDGRTFGMATVKLHEEAE